MANYDQPAFTITHTTIDLLTQAANGEYVVASVTDPVWLETLQLMDNAFGSLSGGSGGTPSGQDINGYGYSHSG